MNLSILPKFASSLSREQRRAESYRQLMREEAKMGGQLFGPVPAGHRREFFCLDQYTWVWHEEWTDESGKQRVVTTRYDIRPQGILKSQGNNSYQLVKGTELKNLYQAARQYRDTLHAQLALAEK